MNNFRKVLVVLFLVFFIFSFNYGNVEKVSLAKVQNIRYDRELKSPLIMRGELAKRGKRGLSPEKNFFNKYQKFFRVENLAENVKKVKEITGFMGKKHLKFEQFYKGIPVRGGEFFLKKENDKITGFSGKILPEIKVSINPSLSSSRAGNIALRYIPDKNNREVAKSEKMIFRKDKGVYRLSYKLHIRAEKYYWVAYVDAINGEILLKYNNIKNVTKTSYYNGNVDINMNGDEYYDSTRNTWVENSSGSVYTEGYDSTQNEKCVQLLWSSSMSIDFYQQKFNHDSWDGYGGSVPVVYNPDESAYYYNGKITIGDMPSTSDIGFVGDLDAVAHEFSHGFCSNTANLEYYNESGALNEANSDIMGNSVERWATGNYSDWAVGEEAMRNGYEFLRSMEDPSESYNSQPEYYSERYTGTSDNGGVHVNSSLGNKFFQLLVDGGTWYSENNGNVTVTGIGDNDALSIWYNSMTTKFTTTTDYYEARDLTIASAEDLFGTDSEQAVQVQNAWAAVGIGTPAGSGGGGGGSTEDPYEPNDSMSEAYEVSAGNTYSSYIYESGDEDYYKISVSESGTLDLTTGNLAGDYDMYLYNSSGTELDKAYTTNDPETITHEISSGTYYIRVNGYNGAYSSSTKYNLTVEFTPDGSGGGGGSTDDPYEPNDSMSEAYEVSAGNTYSSYIYESGDEDYYKISVSESGTLDLTAGNLAGDYDMYLFNSSGTELDKAYTTNDPETINYDVSSGTYYIRVNGYNGAYSSSTMYNLTVQFTSDDTGGGGSGEPQWYITTLSSPVETPHPYENSQTYSYDYSKPGATQVAIHFSSFEFENGYDYVRTYNSNGTEINSYTGTKSEFWTVVEGDYIKIKAFCDYIYNDYGYVIDQVAYYSDTNLGFTDGETKSELNAVTGNITPKVRFDKLKNYPNPFNPETNIVYPVNKSGVVKVVIYNSSGKKVRVLVNEHKEAREEPYTVHWDGKDKNGDISASGIYYCIVKGKGFKNTRKMILLK